MRMAVVGLTAVLALAVSGCGVTDRLAEKAVEEAVESATGVEVDQEGESVTIKGQDGEAVTFTAEAEGKLPEGFPFPLMPGGKVNSSSKVTSNGKLAFFVEIRFQGDAKAAGDFYEKAMKDIGVAEVSRTDSESNGEVTVFMMGENQTQTGTITVMMPADAGEGSVAFMWGDK